MLDREVFDIAPDAKHAVAEILEGEVLEPQVVGAGLNAERLGPDSRPGRQSSTRVPRKVAARASPSPSTPRIVTGAPAAPAAATETMPDSS